MKILALDTSTEYCSTALWVDGDADVRETRAGQSHSDLLLGMIDELLKSRAMSLRDLDGIAFGEGPGSFTGLRIACGVVQGLAFGAGVPVIGVGTLLAMAEGSGAGRVVCCVDARVREIYHAAFVRMDAGERTGAPPAPLRGGTRTGAPAAPLRDNTRTGETHGFPRYLHPLFSGGWRAVHEASLCAPAAAPGLAGDGWLACGSGFGVYRDILEARYAGQLARIDLTLFPHARDIAALAAPRFAAGLGVSADAAAPVYLRDKVALRIDERANR